MKIDNNEPNKLYTDFWDWLFDDGRPVFILALAVGYLYYLHTTTEV